VDFSRGELNFHNFRNFDHGADESVTERWETRKVLLLDSIRVTNWLKEQPRFYNVISANRTTSLQAKTLEFRSAPFDICMHANGRLDGLIYEMGGFRGGGLPFAEMRQRVFVNSAARATHDGPKLSARIREGRPGFE
jgi:hypothetical protein